MSTFNPLQFTNGKYIGFWWEADGVECARRVHSTVAVLRQEQIYITERYRRAVELYENMVIGLSSENLTAAWQFSDWDVNGSGTGPYTLNIVESIVDTMHAEVITNRTKAQFISTGGDWIMQQKAIKNTQFVAGLFDEVKMHDEVAPQLGFDALMFGDGFAKVFVDDYYKRVKMQRVFPSNVVFDDVEAASGPPSTFYEEWYVPRHTLAVDYLDDKEASKIINSTSEFHFSVRPRRSIGDVIRVVEAWKVARNGKNGRHVICTDAGLLLDEEWSYEFYPFIHLTYKKRPRSMLGKGIPEIIAGQQEIINDFREKIDAQLASASPFVWSKPGNGLGEKDFNNLINRVIESDEPPQYIVPQAVSPDLFQQQAVEQNDASSLIGVNQLMMKGEIPPGIVGNGKALRTYNDIKSKRFMRFERDYERMHINSATMMLGLIDGIAEEENGYTLNFEEKGMLDELDYREIRLPKGSFQIRKFPSNFLDDTPSGRLADIESLASIYPEMKPSLARLLQNPDVEYITGQLSVQESSVQRIAEKLLTTDMTSGEIPPIPEMNLTLAVGIMKNYITDATSREVPADRVQKLRDWNSTAQAMIERAIPPPMPGGPMPGMTPPPMPTEMSPAAAMPPEAP